MLNAVDNCPDAANASQMDRDGDALGDACDPDIDGDGFLNPFDNCALDPNPDQADNEGDGLGDVCDSDDDNDGVEDSPDNCPRTYNPLQRDFDDDGLGDACDSDSDGDGVPNADDVCSSTPVGEAVDPATGCSLDQLCPCAGPRGQSVPWQNHGKYETCVVKATKTLVDLGIITEELRSQLISAAAQTDCGKK